MAAARRAVLVNLGQLGDPAVVAEARQRFDRWLASPTA